MTTADDGRTDPAPPAPPCFLCDPSPPALDRERPGHWLAARLACPAHSRHDVQLPSGVSLAAFLARHVAPSPLEGSGLNFLLNPVVVAGRRAWLDSSGGGWWVMEEVFPSACYFDYWVQHRPDCVDALAWRYLSRDQTNRPGPATPAREPEASAWISDMWQRQRRVEVGMRARDGRPFADPADLLAFWDALEQVLPSGDVEDEAGLVARLRTLATVRFGHLRRDATQGAPPDGGNG